jgi:hypothetical protein
MYGVCIDVDVDTSKVLSCGKMWPRDEKGAIEVFDCAGSNPGIRVVVIAK